MLIVWPVLFGILAALFGTLGYTGAAHGWIMGAQTLFAVFCIAFGMSLIVGQAVIKHER